MADRKIQPPAPVSEPPPGQLESLLRLLSRFQRFFGEIGGVFCLALALMTLLGVLTPRLAGGLLSAWAGFLKLWLGWGSLYIVILIFALGVWLLRRRSGTAMRKTTAVVWGRLLLFEGAGFASLAILSVVGGADLARAEQGLDGGRLGWALVELLRTAVAPVGLGGLIWQGLVFGILLILCLIFALGLHRPLVAWARREAHPASEMNGMGAVVSEAPFQTPEAASAAVAAARKRRTTLPPEFRKNFRVDQGQPASPAALPERSDHLPPLELLVNEQFNRADERDINTTAGLIEKTLADFGIPAHVVGFRVGPTVTQFAVEPGYLDKEKNGDEAEAATRHKVRVSQISGLGRDLALALAAERLRIEAPVPGRPYVGIEVPNARTSIVRLRPMLESEVFYKVGSQLAVALGRDVSGAPVVADLGRMPHLLIAGTTGSGKSVCIAALTACLVMNNLPEDLRLVMIDPKMVELVRFNGLPHLLGKVETDLERILAVLRWTVAEMDRRYKVLEASRSRNIDSYNRKIRRRKGEQPLPRIVVMIDELADLMMSAPDQTEHNLVRLAQMARATGIHLVLATQRPSTDVVTGLIKANFPARISFAVASAIDSRVILDSGGAETLLGRGDMLFQPPEAAAPIRVQGVMVSDQEVERVITFWQKALPAPEQVETPPWEEMMAQEQVLADRDNLVEKAIQVVRQEQRASASLLQRRLRVGYPRAARLVDELEELGVIGPAVHGGKERDVLVGPEDEAGQEE